MTRSTRRTFPCVTAVLAPLCAASLHGTIRTVPARLRPWHDGS